MAPMVPMALGPLGPLDTAREIRAFFTAPVDPDGPDNELLVTPQAKAATPEASSQTKIIACKQYVLLAEMATHNLESNSTGLFSLGMGLMHFSGPSWGEDMRFMHF